MPPGSAKTLSSAVQVRFHRRARLRVRELEVEGNSVKFTAIGVYLEKDAFPLLAGPFEKFTNVTMIRPLTGQQYAEKVAERTVKQLGNPWGMYTEEGAEAIKKFIDAFKNETFPAGSSILFTHLPPNTLSVSSIVLMIGSTSSNFLNQTLYPALCCSASCGSSANSGKNSLDEQPQVFGQYSGLASNVVCDARFGNSGVELLHLSTTLPRFGRNVGWIPIPVYRYKQLMFGTMTVIDDELTEGHGARFLALIGKDKGFYVVSSEMETVKQGHSQLCLQVAITSTSLSFFGVHRTAVV
ncbi:Chalcone--flavonone isomerase, partial [Cucurbita argyrosperma subsp. sororia]